MRKLHYVVVGLEVHTPLVTDDIMDKREDMAVAGLVRVLLRKALFVEDVDATLVNVEPLPDGINAALGKAGQ